MRSETSREHALERVVVIALVCLCPLLISVYVCVGAIQSKGAQRLTRIKARRESVPLRRLQTLRPALLVA